MIHIKLNPEDRNNPGRQVISRITDEMNITKLVSWETFRIVELTTAATILRRIRYNKKSGL